MIISVESSFKAFRDTHWNILKNEMMRWLVFQNNKGGKFVV